MQQNNQIDEDRFKFTYHIPVDYLQPIEKRQQLELRLDELLQATLNYDVPPDNNASERAMRTFKVKQKVSGLFRSTNAAGAFAVIRSVIDTAIKNSQNVWMAMNCVATVAE